MNRVSNSQEPQRRRPGETAVPALPRVYLRERLYVPAHLMTPEVKKCFSVVLHNYLPEFDEETGEPRVNRDLLVRGFRRVNQNWYSISRGNLDTVWSVFSSVSEIVDQRAVVPLSFPLRWVGIRLKDGTIAQLRPSQEKFVGDLLGVGYGIGEAPPRFGKTICMTAVICRTQMRTLIIVHQIELAKQFIKEFRRCTNVDAAEHHFRRPLVGFGREWKDFETFDVCVTTWHKFHAVLPKTEFAEGDAPTLEQVRTLERLQAMQKRRFDTTQKAIAHLRNRFGTVLVDEVHRAASPCFSNVVGQFNPWYRMGVTATPDRKDRLDAVIKLITGPTVTVGDEEKVLLRVRPVYTGFAPKFKSFTTYENMIARDPRRTKLALDLIAKDVRDGHSVIAVCTRREHILELTEKMMRMGVTAEGFHGKVKDRDGVLARADSGHTKVVFAMRSMLLGINIPRWSAMHILVPSANPPNFYQEISRVRTPREGKAYAVIRDYLDACGASNGCYRYRHSVYVDLRKAPILFEDEFGQLLKKLPLELILSKAAHARQASSRKATKEQEEAFVGFGGLSGPRRPNFASSAWLSFASEAM